MQEATLSIIEAAAIQPASDEHLLICHHMDFIDPLEDGKYSSEKFKVSKPFSDAEIGLTGLLFLSL